jgi:hypothetical protein
MGRERQNALPRRHSAILRRKLDELQKVVDSRLVLKYYLLVHPQQTYRRLNKLLWMGRLPRATVYWIDDETLPTNFGMTQWDADFALPVIFINSSRKRWLRVLIHEMIHVSEPEMPHGKLFESLIDFYVRAAKNTKKGYRTI